MMGRRRPSASPRVREGQAPDSMVLSAFVLRPGAPAHRERQGRQARAPACRKRASVRSAPSSLKSSSVGAEEEFAKIWGGGARLPQVGVRGATSSRSAATRSLPDPIVASRPAGRLPDHAAPALPRPTIAELAEVVGFTAEVTAGAGRRWLRARHP
jgi:hypothetical protein